MRVLGLMSGTSADGVDAVLANFSGPPQHPRWRIESHHFNPYPAKLQRQLVGIGQGQLVNSETLLELAEAVTEQQALAARACDPPRPCPVSWLPWPDPLASTTPAGQARSQLANTAGAAAS